MTILRAQRHDGSFGDIQSDEYGRLKTDHTDAADADESGLLELRQTEAGELLTATGGG